MSKEHLTTYLNDHLMGAAAAIELLEQFLTEAPDLQEFLAGLKGDIESDRDEVVRVMDHLNISQSRVRKATGWFAEQAAELKFAMTDDESFRRLERLETLALGIQGKLNLWRALAAATHLDTGMSRLNYERLQERALDQLSRVEALRIEAAKTALTAAA
ncbi:MAG TPA: hypothetical protein VFR18_13715 [Terriglobia bacterium]|nr:hypothetical protein [Terriglobia bacterium]